MSTIKSFWFKLRVNNFNPFGQKLLKGKDLVGNLYFEEPRESFPRRTVELINGETSLGEISSADLPVQWRSWLRHTRSDVPTIEELEAYDRQRKETVYKAKLLEEAWQKRKLELKQEDSKQLNEPQSPKVEDNPEQAQTSKNLKKGRDFNKPIGSIGGTTAVPDFEPEAWSPISKK